MMRVQFRLNLGRQDAARLNLDQSRCTEGATLTVNKDVGEQLVRRQIATEVEPPIKAVPQEPVKAVPPAPEIKGESEPLPLKPQGKAGSLQKE